MQLCEALGVRGALLVGHDWGARAVANAVCLDETVASHMVMLSVGYGTNSPHQALAYQQAHNYWYHWYMATARGVKAIQEDHRAFTRYLWDTWSPAGWYLPDEFEATAEAFDNPDWAEIVLHSYRHRWGFSPSYAIHEDDERRLTPPPTVRVPTLVIHGECDRANHPDTSSGKEQFFAARYERVVLASIGHFPQRECGREIAKLILGFVNGR